MGRRASAMYSRRKLKHWRRRKNELEKMGMRYNEGRYKLSCVVRQDTKDHVYCCALNTFHPAHADKLATTAGPRAYVYRLTPDGGVKLMQCYVDEDDEEDYFACCWCASAVPETSGRPMLAVAGGYKGVVRVIDCVARVVRVNLRGHGGGVNDVKAHPLRPHLLLTASKDESCRLWNVDSGACVAIFAGEFGHRNEVLSVDFKPGVDPYDASTSEPGDGEDKSVGQGVGQVLDGDVVFVSGAMDNQIKVWSTRGYPGLARRSDGWGKGVVPGNDAAMGPEVSGSRSDGTANAFPTAHVQTPTFSSHKVHGNYVDCVRWFGDLVLSKSVENVITLFQPQLGGSSGAGDLVTGSGFRKVQDFPLRKCDIWFMRFALAPDLTHMCCGNTAGEVFVWRMGSAGRHAAACATLAHKRCVKAVRQTAMTADGRTVIAACDEGTVWRWDLVDVKKDFKSGAGAGEKKRARTEKEKDDATDEGVDEGVDGGDVTGATGDTIEILD